MVKSLNQTGSYFYMFFSVTEHLNKLLTHKELLPLNEGNKLLAKTAETFQFQVSTSD